MEESRTSALTFSCFFWLDSEVSTLLEGLLDRPETLQALRSLALDPKPLNPTGPKISKPEFPNFVCQGVCPARPDLSSGPPGGRGFSAVVGNVVTSGV